MDDDGEVIAAVTVGKGITRSKAALKHAAHATQVLPELLAALRLIQNMSIDKEDDAKVDVARHLPRMRTGRARRHRQGHRTASATPRVPRTRDDVTQPHKSASSA
jgi:hypothetical protein